jgi:hypothetical protein
VTGIQARGKILGTLAVGEENAHDRLLLFLAGGGGVGKRVGEVVVAALPSSKTCRSCSAFQLADVQIN